MTARIKPNEVPGHLTEHEGNWLANIARGGRVVEIGAYKGRSTCFLASTAVHVLSCEPFCGQPKLRADQQLVDFADVRRSFYANVAACGFDNRIDILELRSRDAYPILARFYKGSIDLIFVDGGHYEEALRVDVLFANLLRRDGVIAFHDYNRPAYTAVTQVVNAWADHVSRSAEVISAPGLIRAFRLRNAVRIEANWYHRERRDIL